MVRGVPVAKICDTRLVFYIRSLPLGTTEGTAVGSRDHGLDSVILLYTAVYSNIYGQIHARSQYRTRKLSKQWV